MLGTDLTPCSVVISVFHFVYVPLTRTIYASL